MLENEKSACTVAYTGIRRYAWWNFYVWKFHKWV